MPISEKEIETEIEAEAEITEGKARILAHTGRIQEISKKATVFYNPAMKHNRDISVFALSVFQEELPARIKPQGAKKESITFQKGENPFISLRSFSAFSASPKNRARLPRRHPFRKLSGVTSSKKTVSRSSRIADSGFFGIPTY